MTLAASDLCASVCICVHLWFIPLPPCLRVSAVKKFPRVAAMQLPQIQNPQSAIQNPASLYPNLPPPVDVRLVTLPAHDCSYLSGRTAISRAFYASRLPAELYHDFMDAGFRRSG